MPSAQALTLNRQGSPKQTQLFFRAAIVASRFGILWRLSVVSCFYEGRRHDAFMPAGD
jgi:hypothetical protein